VEVFFHDGYEIYLTPLPHGEIVLAVLAERGVVGGEPNAWMRARFAEVAMLEKLLEGADSLDAVCGQAPLSSLTRGGFLPGLVLLGDAAGFVDPVTGTGMAQALISAELLAGFLCQPAAFERSDALLATFDRQRRRLLADTVHLTRFILALTRTPILASVTVSVLHRLPRLYAHMIGIAAGTRTLLPRIKSQSASGAG
jgi:flavin-dependent dehydrogenase